MYVGSKALWHEILDDLPRHDEALVLIACATLPRRRSGEAIRDRARDRLRAGDAAHMAH